MKFIYQIGIQLYFLGIWLAALGSGKARNWLEGRKGWRNHLPPQKKGIRYWFHCASLGEFEQARPLIELYHQKGIHICLSFYSPSGYEIRKDYSLAEWVGYLPLDTKGNAHDFVHGMNADKIFFVKYEFWYFHLQAIHRSGVPLYLISALFRENQPFFKKSGSLHRQMLFFYNQIFTQDEKSVVLLDSIGHSNCIYAGDTRFDRVKDLREKRQKLPLIESFLGGADALVAGSSWEPEEEIIQQCLDSLPDWKWVVVPHDIGERHIQSLKTLFTGKYTLYSELEKGMDPKDCSVVIVDKIGLLGNIYPYGKAAFVGGGFRNALHNILEAATWGVPVFFGNETEKYPEARNLQSVGGGFPIAHAEDFRNQIHALIEGGKLDSAGQAARNWIDSGSGATSRIVQAIESSED